MLQVPVKSIENLGILLLKPHRVTNARYVYCCMDLLQMIHEKKLERRRQRRKAAAECQQQDRGDDMMTESPANARDEQQEPVDRVVARQRADDSDVRRRRRRRRQKQSYVDDENSERYENGWPVTRSESEHLAGTLNNADLLASRSEPNTLNQDAPSLTPHPIVYNSMSTPLANRELTVQPAFLQKPTPTNDFDVESRPYYPPLQSNV